MLIVFALSDSASAISVTVFPEAIRDNADFESFMKTLQYEEMHRNEYRVPAEARVAIHEFLENLYNRKRLHSALGYVPPAEFELNLLAQSIGIGGSLAAPPLPHHRTCGSASGGSAG